MFRIGVCRLGKPLVNFGEHIVSTLDCLHLPALRKAYHGSRLTGILSTETYKSDGRVISNDPDFSPKRVEQRLLYAS